MLVSRDDILAIVVDIQERLFPHIAENEQLATNSVKLLKGLKALDIEILVAQQYTKGIGDTIEPIREVLGEFNHMEKTTFSCCSDISALKNIKSKNKKFAILLGIETHICVAQSALELLENGITPILVADCTSSRKLYDKEIALDRLREAGVIVTTYEAILFELCKNAKDGAFKEISKIVK